MKILITGATGFLGFHITELFVNSEYEIRALKRRTSNIDKLPFGDKIKWYNIEDSWKKEIGEYSPDIIIHAAWIGVENESRDDWNTQLSNISFLNELLEVARLSCCKKIVVFGSQAEYGVFSGKVDETQRVNPISAYGAVKCSMQQLVQSFCEIHNIEWIWLRIFSVFGERESNKWLITSTIINLLKGVDTLSFTEGRQKYAYLYVKDFAKAVETIVRSKKEVSGIYNISSVVPIELRDIIMMIKDIINPQVTLFFGALPYRPNQSMHIEGDMTKYFQTFGCIANSDIKQKLRELVLYHKNNRDESI